MVFAGILSALLIGVCVGAAFGSWFAGGGRPPAPPEPRVTLRADTTDLRQGINDLQAKVVTGPWKR